jgi:hypothetical protein
MVVQIARFGIGVAAGEMDKVVENFELELKLDGVSHTLISGLELVKICVFETEDGDVEEDHDDINGYKAPEHAGAGGLGMYGRVMEELDGGKDIEPRDGELLDKEDRDLDLLDDRVGAKEPAWVTGRVSTVDHDRRNGVENHAVSNDHGADEV